jgi:hypothetical protein
MRSALQAVRQFMKKDLHSIVARRTEWTAYEVTLLQRIAFGITESQTKPARIRLVEALSALLDRMLNLSALSPCSARPRIDY